MTLNFIAIACAIAGFASALVAGVFQAFSDFIMRGLALAPSAAAVEAMQRINETVLRSVFLLSFLVLAPATLVLAIYAVVGLESWARLLVLLAAGVYWASVFAVTMFGNVPMNQTLAKLGAATHEAADYWQVYLRRWTHMNHVRTVGSACTAGLLLVAAVAA